MRVRVKRQFNYTHRSRIPERAVRVRVSQDPGAPKPLATVLDLGLREIAHGHDPDAWNRAEVVLEASRHSTSSFCRMPVGNISEVIARTPPVFSSLLETFSSREGIVFAVKVVAVPDRRILAEATRVVPEDETGEQPRSELLKVVAADLGEVPWRLAWNSPDPPHLLINSRIPGCEGLFRRDAIAEGLVLPQILGEVLLRLCLDRTVHDEEWAVDWFALAGRYHPNRHPDDVDVSAVAEWVDNVIDGFSRQYQFATRLAALEEPPAAAQEG